MNLARVRVTRGMSIRNGAMAGRIASFWPSGCLSAEDVWHCVDLVWHKFLTICGNWGLWNENKSDEFVWS